MPLRNLPPEALDKLPLSIYRLDLDLRIIYVSRSLASSVGYPPESVEGRLISEIGLPADSAEKLIAEFRTVLSGGNPVRFDWQLPDPSGHLHWLRYEAIPEVDGSGRITGILGYASEITASAGIVKM